MKTELLPFTIRIVKDDIGLQKAVQMRKDAYGRHLPEFAESMDIEESDRAAGSVVLLAESKIILDSDMNSKVLGTMRIQTNEFEPLAMEQSVQLPVWLQGAQLAEATRFGVINGIIGKQVKVALCKALFMYCQQKNVDWMVITARSPLDKSYEDLLFFDVFEENKFIPMSHVNNLPHRVMAKSVPLARERWAEANHPLFEFVFETNHPDIDLS